MPKPNAAGIPVHDLQSFVRFLEEKGELIRISEPVDPVLEVTEIADRFVKDGENPALLFENPVPGAYSERLGRTETARNADGKPVPLLINLFASRRRMAWALGCHSLEEAVARIEEPLKMGPPSLVIIRYSISIPIFTARVTGQSPYADSIAERFS